MSTIKISLKKKNTNIFRTVANVISETFIDYFHKENLIWLLTFILFIPLGVTGLHRLIIGRLKSALFLMGSFALLLFVLTLNTSGFLNFLLLALKVSALVIWLVFYIGDLSALLKGNTETWVGEIKADLGFFSKLFLILLQISFFELLYVYWDKIPVINSFIATYIAQLS